MSPRGVPDFGDLEVERFDWGWALPGAGRPCGRDPDHLPLRFSLCPRGHVNPYVDACDRRDCPTCWRKGWLRREAGAVASDLIAESKARKDRGELSTPLHASLSPPPREWGKVTGAKKSLRAFRRLRTRAYAVARKAGLNGGRLIFHPFRCQDRSHRRETPIDGVHFHVLGFGWIPPDAFKRSGWVVRNHGVRKGARSLVGTAEYLLDHSGRAETTGISAEGKSEGLTLTVTAFGRLVGASETPSQGMFCDLCERCWPMDQRLDLEYIGQGPPPTESEPVDWSKWRAYRPVRAWWDAPPDGKEWVSP